MTQPTLPTLPPPLIPSTAQLVEALLFVAADPLTVPQLAAALELPPDAVEAALDELSASTGRGVQVQRSAERVQLVSAPAAAPAIERLLGIQTSTRLSGAALEALAVVAYRQPVTRAQVDAVRGVDSGGVLRVLLGRELIAEVGRLESAGRPLIYATTEAFLRQFGLSSLTDLPPLAVPEPPPA